MNNFKNPNIFLVGDAALTAIIVSCSKSVLSSVSPALIDAAKILD